MPEPPGWSDRSAPYLFQTDIRRGDPWGAEAAAQGRVGTHRILMAGENAVPAEVSPWIKDPTAVLRRRLVSMDGEPVEVADSWFPMLIAEVAPLISPKKIRGGTAAILAECGLVARRVVEYIAAPPIGADLGELLDLPFGARVLRLTRVSWTDGGNLLEVAVMTMKPDLPDGDLRQIRYELTLD